MTDIRTRTGKNRLGMRFLIVGCLAAPFAIGSVGFAMRAAGAQSLRFLTSSAYLAPLSALAQIGAVLLGLRQIWRDKRDRYEKSSVACSRTEQALLDFKNSIRSLEHFLIREGLRSVLQSVPFSMPFNPAERYQELRHHVVTTANALNAALNDMVAVVKVADQRLIGRIQSCLARFQYCSLSPGLITSAIRDCDSCEDLLTRYRRPQKILKQVLQGERADRNSGSDNNLHPD